MRNYEHKVQYYETDKMGITHHSNYIRWMEEARIDFLTQIGWPYEKMEEEGIISPVIGVQCKYLRTTTFPDTVQVRVFVEEFKGVKLKIGYEMYRGEEKVFEGQSEHCFLNLQGRPLNVKREYPKFYEDLSQFLEES